MVSYFSLMENSILTYFDSINYPFIDKLMYRITTLGDKGLIWIFIALMLLIFRKYREVGVVLALALLVDVLLCNVILKNIVQRTRPFNSDDLYMLSIAVNLPIDYSFPSGHTAASFASAFVIAKYIKKTTFFVYLLAGLIAFSRIYLCVHYPSDVIAGALLGAFCGWLAIFLYNKFFQEHTKGLLKFN